MFVLNIGLLYALLAVLALIFLNVVLGVAIAIKKGTFDLAELPRFLKTEIFPYGLSLMGLTAAAQIDYSHLADNISTLTDDAILVLAWTAIGAYVLRMLQEIGRKIFELFGVTVTDEKGFATVRVMATTAVVVFIMLIYLFIYLL
jgi:hypothetical protein